MKTLTGVEAVESMAPDKHYLLFVKTLDAGFYLEINKEQALDAVSMGMVAEINCLGYCMVNQRYCGARE